MDDFDQFGFALALKGVITGVYCFESPRVRLEGEQNRHNVRAATRCSTRASARGCFYVATA